MNAQIKSMLAFIERLFRLFSTLRVHFEIAIIIQLDFESMIENSALAYNNCISADPPKLVVLLK